MPSIPLTHVPGAVRGPALRLLPLVAGTPGFDLAARARQAAALRKALANPDRLRLLCPMVDAERNVANLGTLTGIAQPSLSQRLGVLREDRLLTTRREGRHVRDRGDAPAALALRQTRHALFGAPGDLPAGRRPVSPPNRAGRAVA